MQQKLKANGATVWRVLALAARQYSRLHGYEASAGMAFYGIFALFPLLLFLVAMGSFVLETEKARDSVIGLATRIFPISQDVVVQNLQRVLAARGSVTFIAAITLLWSSSGYFTILIQQINRAWPVTRARHAVEGRMVALGMIMGLGGLLILWLSLTSALLPYLRAPLWVDLLERSPLLRRVVSFLTPWLLPFLFFFALYCFAPNTRVRWKGSLWAAGLVTVAWRALTRLFLWYLGSGFSRYRLVYGSLGSIIGLMLWMHWSSMIVVFGAHVSAAISIREREQTSCAASDTPGDGGEAPTRDEPHALG